jgi:hypothetical protein
MLCSKKLQENKINVIEKIGLRNISLEKKLVGPIVEKVIESCYWWLGCV